MGEEPKAHLYPFWDGLANKLSHAARNSKASVRSWRRNNAQESLEKALAKIIETANGHRTKGQAKGSQVFVDLLAQANSKIDKFCKDWGVERSTIEAQAPSLRDLDALAIPENPTPPFFKALGIFVGGVTVLVVIGFSSGIVQAAHNWALHLLHAH